METKQFDLQTQLKLHLLEKFSNPLIGGNKELVDFCREAYKFLVEGDIIVYKGTDDEGNHLIERKPINIDKKGNARFEGRIPEWAGIEPKDGVYFGYEYPNGDKKIELFNGQNEKENIAFVAFKFGAVSLKVWYEDIENVKLTTDDNDADMPYITKYSNAAHDFSGKARTEDLLARGLKCECDGFKRDWYIPSIGELYVMYLMKDALNEALVYAKRKPLKDTWYWSSTERSATAAWRLGFDNGGFSYGSKTYEGSVRPVSAFNQLSL